jgi:phage I-like protein
MSHVLISSALACALRGEGAPDEFVFLPEGRHVLRPQSHPKGIMVNLPADEGEAVAAVFNEALAKRGNVKAWCDFEHTRRHPVSCYPIGFRYEAGTGIVATVEWSKSGREAVEGRDARFFSPEFFIGKNGVPTGLPERGPVGALCTEPAFREIPAIAASDAADDETKQMDTSTFMNALVTLVSCGLLSEAEAAREGADQLAAERLRVTCAEAAKVPALEKELAGLKAERKDEKVRAGLMLFDRAVKAGLAGAADEGEKAKYLTAAESNELAMQLLTEKVEAAEATGADITRPIISARAASPANHEQRIAAAQAKARTDLGADAPFAMVWARAAEIDPPAFV